MGLLPCGRYLIHYPNKELVVAAGVSGPIHVLGPGYRDDPLEGPIVSTVVAPVKDR
jgi:hypothetical protein